MNDQTSIFFDLHLPNSTTWFYFCGLLAVALFFKFSRFFCMRNWDILTLFLPMPGFLLLLEQNDHPEWGYGWLLGCAGYFLVRCLIDLALVQRPALQPNLNRSGLAWLAGTLYVSLVALAVPRTEPIPESPRRADNGAAVGKVPDLTLQWVKEEKRSLTLQWVERSLTLVGHLSICVGLVLIGWRHFEDVHSGMAAATFYLLLPYTFLLLPGKGLARWNHSWIGLLPMALMVWSVFCYRRPSLAGVFLGLAAGFVFFPLLTLPVWLSFYHQRGMGRFFRAFLVTALGCLLVLGLLLWIQGEPPHQLRGPWTQANWLPWQPPPSETSGIWQSVPEGNGTGDATPTAHWVYRIPIFLAYIAFVLATGFWPTPKNLAHVLALSAACLVGIEFWYADQGGIHVFWYLPFLLLLTFRPNLSSLRPPIPPSDLPGTTERILAWLWNLFLRLVGSIPWFRRPTRSAASHVDELSMISLGIVSPRA